MDNKFRQISMFLGLTFLISWIFWAPFVLEGLGLFSLPHAFSESFMLFMILGAFGPFLASLILIAGQKEKGGIKIHIKKLFQWRVKPLYILLALSIPLFVTMVAHFITNISGLDMLPDSLIAIDTTVPMSIIFVGYFFMMMILGGGQEELGWRGYAQTPLVESVGMFKANLILGIVWGMWHLPLWFIPDDGHSNYSFIAFLGLTMSMSMILGVIHELSGRKAIVSIIFHGMSNAAVPFFPTLHMEKVAQPGYIVWVMLYAVVGIVMTLIYYKKVVWITKMKSQPSLG